MSIDTMPPSYARARIVRALALAATLAPACAREREPPRPRHPNVVVISLDSLRPDHLGCYGYASRTGAATSPHVDRLAQDGVLFEQAVSTTTWTLPAHHALMSGMPDLAHGVLSDGYGPTRRRVQLAQVLADAGYATAGFYSGLYLGPQYGFGDGFEVWNDESGVAEALLAEPPDESPDGPPGEGDPDGLRQAAAQVAGQVERGYHDAISAKRVSDAGCAWLEEQRARAPQQPFFLFLHYFDVHYDYLPPEESFARAFWPGGTRPPIDGSRFFERADVHAGMPADALAGVVSWYDGEIRWTDSQVGKVLAALDRLGVARDTIVVVVSDHGDEFFEHGVKGHRQNLFQPTLAMAWVMRWPGVLPAGKRLSGRVSMADVAPTLVDLCDVGARADFHADPVEGIAPAELLHGMLGRSQRARIDGGPGEERGALAFLANSFTDPSHPTYSFALVGDRFKVVVTERYELRQQPDGSLRKVPIGARGSVFDLLADPGETRDLARSGDPAVNEAIARYDAAYGAGGTLARWLAAVECGPPPPPVSDVERRRLAQLGYTELADARPPLPPGTKLAEVTPRLPPFPRP